MRLRDYFGGRRVSLRTRLPPEEVEIRINARAVAPFNLFRLGTIGSAGGSGRVRLRYRGWIPALAYTKPVLAGRIHADGTGARLDLVYRAPAVMFALFALFWLAAPAQLLYLTLVAPGPHLARDVLLLAILLPACALLPLAIAWLARIRADADLAEILAFLARETEAREAG